MQVIDAHAHLFDVPGYADHLLAAMDAAGIERACVSGLGPLFMCQTNAGVRAELDRHPDRFIGAYFVRPGVDDAGAVTRAHETGFRMLKVTIPKAPYDDPRFFPLWDRAQALHIPVLFHTGFVTTAGDARGEGISSWYMHPMRLEPVAREFPELGIIVAHLGVHWNHDAAELARMCPNVYVDLTGEPTGWRARLDREGADTYLWWPGAWKKVVFGTDVVYGKIQTILQEDMARLDRYNVPQATRERIFAGNLLRLLGES